MPRFKHDDHREVALPERPVRKYEDVNLNTCEVRWQRFAGLTHYRTTLGDIHVALEDDRVFGLGLLPEDMDCPHEVDCTAGLARFGYGRCTLCEGHLWCASWVAEGLYGLAAKLHADGYDDIIEILGLDDAPSTDGTVDWANRLAAEIAGRLPKPTLVMA